MHRASFKWLHQYIGLRGETMLEEMQLFCLMLLLGGHALLIRGCTKMNLSIPASTETISSKFDGVSTILDELADILAEFGYPEQTSAMTKQAIGGSIPEMLMATLMGKVMQPQEHGNSQQKEWEILEDLPPTQKQTQD